MWKGNIYGRQRGVGRGLKCLGQGILPVVTGWQLWWGVWSV